MNTDDMMEDVLSGFGSNINNPSKKRKIYLDNDSKTNIDNIDNMDNMNNNNNNKIMPRTEDVIIPLKVDLLQLYISQSQSLSVVRNRLCNECDGKGICDLNIITPKIDSDPNLANKCSRCFGRGVFPDEKQFTFSIQGYSHNDQIIFKHEADEKFGYEAGDIIVILNQIPDATFQREGAHLYIKKEIVLVEALCGGEFYIKHLDGRILKFNTRPGEVLAPYQIKCIPNQGMPYKDNLKRRGHIFVQFEVKFPPQPCNPHMINVLKRFLPPPPTDPLQTLSKQQPNRLTNCEIVDLAYPKPQQYQQQYSNNNNNNHNHHNHNHNNNHNNNNNNQ